MRNRIKMNPPIKIELERVQRSLSRRTCQRSSRLRSGAVAMLEGVWSWLVMPPLYRRTSVHPDQLDFPLALEYQQPDHTAWVGGYLLTSRRRPSMARNRKRGDAQRQRRVLFRGDRWIYALVGVTVGILLWPLFGVLNADSIQGFFIDLLPEAVGITFTVLILDNLDRQRERTQTREELIRRMHSRFKDTAIPAIEELRVLGHLSDGSIRGRELRGSNWMTANLYEADLRDTDLTNAVFIRADLVKANLTGAKVQDGQLARAFKLWQAIMPDGTLYNGRMNLQGDLALARKKGFSPSDPASLAEFYGVSQEDYQRGQAWANQELATLLEDEDDAYGFDKLSI
ncbi:MAG: pentapeptide repeat-containing protein [Chloroflexi bacterium]|nr:pentapeptide repeat-containing protein [Chloroflexota bacterium]